MPGTRVPRVTAGTALTLAWEKGASVPRRQRFSGSVFPGRNMPQITLSRAALARTLVETPGVRHGTAARGAGAAGDVWVSSGGARSGPRSLPARNIPGCPRASDRRTARTDRRAARTGGPAAAPAPPARIPVTLERYRPLVGDWERFVAAHRSPEPVTLRVRSGRISRAALTDRLGGAGFRPEPVTGLDAYLRIPQGARSVAQTLEHWLGLFHVQQAVMALPALALGVSAGERVLDLCAAPGGKTTHLAELMGETGPLVAVEPKEKRIRGLLGNIYRLGYRNVIVVAGDGRTLPDGASFDRVLVDAPCSGEGNYRRRAGRLPPRTAGFSRYVTRVQEALLRHAVRLTRPGGTIVYATCTYAPEENEAVVDRVCRDGGVTVGEIPLGLPHSPGLTAWAGEAFHPDLARTWRVYPHHMDSGGLYMARLRRRGAGDARSSGRAAGWGPIPAAFPGADAGEASTRIRRALSELVDRFGFDPELVGRMAWTVRGKHIWSQSAGIWPESAWSRLETRRARIVSVGMRAFRGGHGRHETPSSQFLRAWADEIGEARTARVGTAELRRILAGESLPPAGLPAGPVALVWEGRVLGRGMVGSRGLVHELGRADAERLLAIIGEAERAPPGAG